MLQPALLMIAGVILLVAGAEFMVRGAARLATAAGLSSLFVGLTIVAFATSSPELVVSIQASLADMPGLAVGNVVGSNICNIAIILGITALVKPIPCKLSVIRREVPLVIFATLLFWWMCVDGITRGEAWVLVFGLAAYTTWAYLTARSEPSEATYEELRDRGPIASIVVRNLVLVGLGLGGLIFGSDLLVNGAVEIAEMLGWSDEVIGLTVVAIGTSLPEVATSIVAAARGEPDIAVGNVMGSNLWNLLGVAGIAGTIQGLDVDPQLIGFDIPILLVFSLACLPIMSRQRRVSRGEGVVLLAGYAAYVGARLGSF